MIRYRRFSLLPIDVLAIVLSHVLAYLVRFEGRVPPDQWEFFWVGAGVAIVVKPAFFVLSGFYRRLWRYASVPDLVHIVKTVFLASLTSTAFTLFLVHNAEYSRSTHVLSWMFLTAFILGRSLAWRLLQERHYEVRAQRGAPVLIVGAGMGGKILLEEIKRNQSLTYGVVGFLDDDRGKIGGEIHGKPVLGPIRDLRAVARDLGVKKVIIAIPSAPAKLIRQVVHLCQTAGLEVQTLPVITDMLDNHRLAAQVRNVNLEDLLGRDPVKLDTKKIEAYITGRTILVTGAGGSIGSEICRQVARFRPRELVLFETAESPLHSIQLELEHSFPELRQRAMLGDIRDREQVKSVFEATRPNVVFHAAAYKHVPMMEYHPLEAVKTNILGTRNLAYEADLASVERFVMISTDKAVNPTNVMGASKRVAEMFVQAFNDESSTEFVTVRFGNVLGSNGSVVPLFQEQIRHGGPITVTHRDVVRYFMTIPEASQLVLQAGSMGRGGEIFLLDMGEPVKIVDLAEELIRLSGLEPYDDIEIVFTGLRPGEKLFEELLVDGEGIKPTAHKKILVAEARPGGLEAEEAHVRELTFCVLKSDPDLAIQKLREIVPEYRPAGRPLWPKVEMHPAALRPAEETPARERRGPPAPGTL